MCLAGPQFDVPYGVTPAQLETLLRKFLDVEEAVPYSFFVEDRQVRGPVINLFVLQGFPFLASDNLFLAQEC